MGIDFCIRICYNIGVKVERRTDMKELKNLKKAIEELNSPTVYEDGETLDSMFEFKIREGEHGWQIYDCNEYYNIDYLEEVNATMYLY